MKRNFIATSSFVVLSLLLTAAGACAQSGVRATVPFAFKVGRAHVPAGTYTIVKESDTNIIRISNVQTGQSVLAMGRPESPSKKTEKLIFRYHGSQYTLTEIWGTAGNPGMAVAAPREKRALEVANGPSSAERTFEIALK